VSGPQFPLACCGTEWNYSAFTRAPGEPTGDKNRSSDGPENGQFCWCRKETWKCVRACWAGNQHVRKRDQVSGSNKYRVHGPVENQDLNDGGFLWYFREQKASFHDLLRQKQSSLFILLAQSQSPPRWRDPRIWVWQRRWWISWMWCPKLILRSTMTDLSVYSRWICSWCSFQIGINWTVHLPNVDLITLKGDAVSFQQVGPKTWCHAKTASC
jgi:hypothetical protein